ncbi:calcium/proton exchanger [Neoconidiobolus thromboides FSU 785]|nr:calcium/proton exchanger [Neoconidiobolus thromboides FSU 785]
MSNLNESTRLLSSIEQGGGSASPDLNIIKQLKYLFLSNYINILLVFVPLGAIASSLHLSNAAIFFLNFFAIIPLASLLGTATEEVAKYMGQTIGGLVNATFGNAVELIVSILALRLGLIRVVQASLLGSILSNLLLVLGFCFFFGGLKHDEQSFNVTAAQTNSSLLGICVLSLLVPAAFHNVLGSEKEIAKGIMNLSHGTAVIMLILYVAFLVFQLKTHTHLFEAEDDDEEEAHMSLGVALVCLLGITIIVSISAEYLVGSIEGLTQQLGLSDTFVGIILVPIVGNAAEHMTAVTVAMKNKMDLSLGVAVGSSMQIALFVTPVLVILGWIIGQPMTLFFDTFETAVLFITVLIVNYLIQDGKSNWLEGLTLIAAYCIIAMAFFFYPQTIQP